MDRATLQASKRPDLGTRASRRLRNEGLVPAVLYGHERDAVHLTVPGRDLERLLHEGARMVDLEIGGTIETALLKEIQYDALGDHLLHLDLTRVAMDELVTVTVPVALHGLPKGVQDGGVLDHILQDVEIECLPANIPDRILIEIAALEIGDIIHLTDIEAPEGVTFLADAEAPIVTVHPPVLEEKAEEEVEAEIGAEPELIGGKAEEEEAEEEAEG